MWGDGTAGYASKGPRVSLLNQQTCQRAKHECQGVYVCNQLQNDLLIDERYEPDLKRREAVFKAETEVNQIQGESPHAIAAM